MHGMALDSELIVQLNFKPVVAFVFQTVGCHYFDAVCRRCRRLDIQKFSSQK
jgi:hypothetical protein